MVPDRLLLLEPRGACGGVEAAVQSLAWLVLLDEPAVHCFHHVVHNDDVVRRFEGLGVTFVEDPDDVPAGATVLLSAHGTAPAVSAAIGARAGRLVDAVCPLVAKVHREVAARSAAGDRIVYVGRAGHDESDAVLALAPQGTTLVADAADLDALPRDGAPIAVLAQTTLRVDELEAVEAAAFRRFARVWTPPRTDICSASTTRQAVVRAVAPRCDLVVVVGAASSSNTASLVDAALEAGARRAIRVASADELPADLGGVVAVTAGASTPDRVIDAVIERLGGTARAEIVHGPTESAQRFGLPPGLRRLLAERMATGTLDPSLVALASTSSTSAEDLLTAAEDRAGAAST